MTNPDPTTTSCELPHAVMKSSRRPSFVWIIPLLALLLAGWLGLRAWRQRGVIITVQLQQGYGLRPGDEVRYKGITVGEIREVSLDKDLQSIIVTAGLNAGADKLARTGSRFWVVRPQLRLDNVQGLETLIGPRYLSVLPGKSESVPWRRFIGLEEPPVVESIESGDLEIIVYTDQRGGLNPGSPVTYRQINVGTILSVGLASDGGNVEARLHIKQAFAPLIRTRTRFWETGGVQAHGGLTGFSLEIESLESALRGSIALATPPEPQAGEMVRTGHRFELFDEPDKDWLEWEPMIAIGSSLLPVGAPMPSPLRARMAWTQGRLFKNRRSRHGWLLQTDRGLLGPEDLLRPGDKADGEGVELEVAGVIVPLDRESIWSGNSLALIDARVDRFAWLSVLISHPDEPEDCIAIADPSGDPLPLTAARLTPVDDTWRLDRSISVDESWHGAVVVARESGHVIGVLLVNDDDAASIALIPADR